MDQQLTLEDSQEDQIWWKLTTSGTYSAKSAYEIQFEGTQKLPIAADIWKPWGPTKCCYFVNGRTAISVLFVNGTWR